MINSSAYYFSPSAIAITLNVSAGFLASETIQVSVAAGAAVKVANQLTTQMGKVLNLGYTVALEYRTFRLSGVNTVFGYTPPNTYHYRDVKIYAYLRLDASNNGATGDVVFLPYEVDYDGKILGEGTPASYPDITIVNGVDGYSISNANADNDSGLVYYYIHIATIDKPENNLRTWDTNLQSGQLETAKGNNEKGDGAWQQMFKLVNNLIQPQKAFEKIYFQSGVVGNIIAAYADRIFDTVSTSLDGFASWSNAHAIATTQSIASYVKATVESLKGIFLRKDQDDETKYKLKMDSAEVVTDLSVGGSAKIEGDATVAGNVEAKTANIEEDLSVGGSAEVNKDLTVGNALKTNKILPRTGNTVAIGGGSDKIDVNGSLEVTGGSEFKQLTHHRKGLQVGVYEPGLLGTGAEIDEDGNTTVESLTARSFFSAPVYRFNRITVIDGESWSTNGLGTIEEVTPITRTTGYISLYLDDGEYGSVALGDICRGIYNEMAAGEVEGGVLFDEDGVFDECGFKKRYGFFTSYFWIKEIVEYEEGKCTFLYELRNASTPHPCKFMKFAQYGNFIDDTRQSSSYENTHPAWYRVVYIGVNDWIVQPENISQLQGWIKGFTIKLRNGNYFTFPDRGLYIDKNIYFGEAITELDPATIENLKDELELYNIELDIAADTITVDPTGNVLGGLWTEEKSDGQTYRKYRLHTAITAKKGEKYLLLADDKKDAKEGEYKIYVASGDCDYFVENGTVYITAIKNIKDQTAGTDDDVNFDFDAMREMKEVKVSIIIDCEGKGSVNRTFCITVNHVDTAFISAMLDNQVANVSWNTKASEYVGLPYTFNIKAWHNTEELDLKDLVLSGLDTIHYVKNGGAITIKSLPEELAEVTNVNVTFTVEYAGVIYERTLVHTINKTQDTNVYELIPSPSSINAWKENNVTNFSSEVLSCLVRCTSSESEPYMLTQEQMTERGLSIMVAKKSGGVFGGREVYNAGDTLAVKDNDEHFVFYLVSDDKEIDEQDVIVVYDGEDGEDAVLYEIRPSVATVTKQKDNLLNPSEVTFSVFVRHGGDQPQRQVGFVVITDSSSKLLFAEYTAAKTVSVSNATFPITAKMWLQEADSSNEPLAEASVNMVSDGADGDEGRGIADVETEYALGDSYEVPPSSVDFDKEFPATTNGKYVWMRQRQKYTDNETSNWMYVCTTGKPGETGKAGQTIRMRGKWTTDTEFVNDAEFIDVVAHSNDGVMYSLYKCTKTHTSGKTFTTTNNGDTLWDLFSKFENLATSVLLANQGYIDVMGAGRLWIGTNEYKEGAIGWLMTKGMIRHTGTGLTLTQDGYLYDPDGLHLKVGDTSLIEMLFSTGIDIKNGTILLTADNFKLRNNSGMMTAYIDVNGNLTLAGVINNSIQVITDDNCKNYGKFEEGVQYDAFLLNPLTVGQVLVFDTTKISNLVLPSVCFLSATDGADYEGYVEDMSNPDGRTIDALRRCLGKKIWMYSRSGNTPSFISDNCLLAYRRDEIRGVTDLDVAVGSARESAGNGDDFTITPTIRFLSRFNYGAESNNLLFIVECKSGSLYGRECIYWEISRSATPIEPA